MTNEQTILLLKGLRVRIEQAMSDAKECLPEPHKETYTQHTFGCSDCFIPFSKRNCSPETHPDHYETHELVWQPALEPFIELLNSIDTDIEMLSAASSDKKSKRTA